MEARLQTACDGCARLRVGAPQKAVLLPASSRWMPSASVLGQRTIERVNEFSIAHAKPCTVRHPTGRARPQPLTCAAAHDSEPSVSGAWTASERELIWNAVPRPLLKLGKAGANSTHVRSLQELLQAHLLVKVQLNGDPQGAQQLAEQLAADSGAVLVEVQHRTILLAKGTTLPSELLDFAEGELVKIRKYHEKRKNRGMEVEGEEAEAPPAGRSPAVKPSRPPAGPGGVRPGGPPRAPPGGRGGRKPEAGPKGPGIDELISSSMSRGPLSKETLKKEWVQLAGEIKKQEEQEERMKRSQSTMTPARGAARRRTQSQAPWRRASAEGAAR